MTVTATVRTWDHSFACGIHDAQPCTCKEDSPVSGATYRIDVSHDPGSHAGIDWIARVVRLSDEYQVAALWGRSGVDAVAKARQWVTEQSTKESSFSVLVGDDGAEVTS